MLLGLHPPQFVGQLSRFCLKMPPLSVSCNCCGFGMLVLFPIERAFIATVTPVHNLCSHEPLEDFLSESFPQL